MVPKAHRPSDLTATSAFSSPHSSQVIKLLEVVGLGLQVGLKLQAEEELKEVVILFMLILVILKEEADSIVPN